MTSLLVGLVVLGLGALFIWRSRGMRQNPNSSPIATRQGRQYRDAGVVIAAGGTIIVLASLLTLAKGGL